MLSSCPCRKDDVSSTGPLWNTFTAVMATGALVVIGLGIFAWLSYGVLWVSHNHTSCLALLSQLLLITCLRCTSVHTCMACHFSFGCHAHAWSSVLPGVSAGHLPRHTPVLDTFVMSPPSPYPCYTPRRDLNSLLIASYEHRPDLQLGAARLVQQACTSLYTIPGDKST